jgi:two-component system, OmpR family, response regulator
MMAKKRDVLVIDDSRQITKMLSEFLEIKGYKCTACNDGRAGLEIILQHKFNVVLLDLAMPKFGGKDVIESLADSGKIKEQNIIIFTASSVDSDEIRQLLKKGAKMCIKKPIQVDYLISALEGLGLS